jgi:hypothetical protein
MNKGVCYQHFTIPGKTRELFEILFSLLLFKLTMHNETPLNFKPVDFTRIGVS